jgi:hypothetical protein
MRHFGIGELTAPMILCELGDVTRLSASRKARSMSMEGPGQGVEHGTLWGEHEARCLQ